MLDLLRSAPPLPFHLLVGLAAAAQNLIPVPVTDLLVLFAAFLKAPVHGGWVGVLGCAWLGNVGLAASFYGLARLYRARRSQPPIIRWLLSHLRRHGAKAPERWTIGALFVSSYLPVRPLLPVIAALAGVPLWRALVPLGLAAALWYGGVVQVGTEAGRNFDAVARAFAGYEHDATIVVGALLAAGIGWWLARRIRRDAETGREA